MSESIECRGPLVVAIDGPAASGKSSTAKWVARELGIRHVDSGSLYRAATAAALRTGATPERWTEAGVLAAAAGVTLEPGETTFHPRLGGADIEEELRGKSVTSNVPFVAKMPGVRAWVNAQCQRAAESHAVVVDGRDMGTAVFPTARVKVFLIADPWERARRRVVQRLGRAPMDAEVSEEVLALAERDRKDAAQTQRADDAVVIDTTTLTQEEQVERIVALVRRARQGGGAT